MKRDVNADFLKVVAIFGVVFIHTPGDTTGLSTSFRFCVPVFVTLWAFYFEAGLAKRSAGSHWGYIRSRIIRLIVPYVFWTCVYLALLHPSISEWKSTPLRIILGSWCCGYGWAGQYFVVILLQLTVLLSLFRRALGKKVIYAILIAGIPLYLAASWWLWRVPVISGVGYRFFLYWLPYAALGIGFVRGYIPRIPFLLLMSIAVISLAIAPYEYHWAYVDVPHPSPYILLSVYIGSLALMMALRPSIETRDAVVPLVSSSWSGFLDTVLGYVGRNTFPIFLANPLIIYFIPKQAIESMGNGLPGIAQHGLLSFCVMCTCLLFGECLKRIRLGILVGI